MKVYKFGGASVKDAAGVKNLCDIVSSHQGELFVVVSAMGKMTNALEEVLEFAVVGKGEDALAKFAVVEHYHNAIVAELFANCPAPKSITSIYERARVAIEAVAAVAPAENYDAAYDRLVSFGELISTTIIAEYLRSQGLDTHWMDMQRNLVTDSRFREANVDLELSAARMTREAKSCGCRIIVAQGFIGATAHGVPTTLGREGSDYTASVVAYMLSANDVTIWKDVPGVLNADPKIFPEAVMIDQMTYLDAIELSYSGAQIIHPKTIKPLQNKNIPLYVKPFGDKDAMGSVIKGQIDAPVSIPVLILKGRQTLISIRPLDFSFVLAERLSEILSLFEKNKVKVNLIQSSAVNLSLCVDTSRMLPSLVEQLGEQFAVKYNTDMELLTIRGYTPEQVERYENAPEVFLAQKTRRIMRIARRISVD